MKIPHQSFFNFVIHHWLPICGTTGFVLLVSWGIRAYTRELNVPSAAISGEFSPTKMFEVSSQGALAFTESKTSADFEAGNIGSILKKGPYEYHVSLRSDNDDALPEFWRQWWFFALENLPTDQPVVIILTGAGQWAPYLPVFYEGSAPLAEFGWKHFAPSSVDQPDPLTVRIKHRFRSSRAYLARFVPYGLSNLLRYLRKIAQNPRVTLHVAGLSMEHRPLPVVSIGGGERGARPTVFIHARTHPGEVGSSFLLEGFLDHLLSSSDPRLVIARNRFRFEVLPILNVDGVYRGNHRVTPGGINLEGKWYPEDTTGCQEREQQGASWDPPIVDGNSQQPEGQSLKVALGAPCYELDPTRTPQEILIWHRWIKNTVRQGARPVVALNLHTSSVHPHVGVFAFPHFGPDSLGYREAEAQLYGQQAAFWNGFMGNMGRKWLMPLVPDGGRHFLQKNLPETWWWKHFGSQVMALTVESTYGRVPGTSRAWIGPRELRRIGAAMAAGLAGYLEKNAGR